MNDRDLVSANDVSPVLHAIGVHAVAMAQTLAVATGLHGLVRISLARELAERVGIQPGGSCDVMTPAGLVEIHVEA